MKLFRAVAVSTPVLAGSLLPGVLPAVGVAAQEAAAPPTIAPAPDGNTYNLADFGPIATAAQAQKTLEIAAQAIQKRGGGVLVIPRAAPADWQPRNVSQEALRTPVPPAPAKAWSFSPGVTIIDARRASVQPPQFTGMMVTRTFNLPPGESSPHWQYHPMLHLDNNFLAGTSDYRGELTEAVAAGKARRFYVPTLSGIFPGQSIEARAPGGKMSESLQVQKLGYDHEKKASYFVADSTHPWEAGTELMREDRFSMIRARTNANNELQTFDVDMIRHHYSQGDSYLFDATMFYLGNPRSPQRKRFADGVNDQSGFGSVLYNATVASETNIFRAEVASYNAANNEVVFTNATNAQTLSTGRPIINMNPKKWMTGGSAYIGNPGGAILNWGSSLCSRDAPWSRDVIGRFFAIDMPSECVPGTDVRRWYLITGFAQHDDGVKVLNVQRFWWGAKNDGVGISRLYDPRHFTSNLNKPMLLKYVIAPGSYAYDVADGVGKDETQSAGAARHAFRIAPYADSGTAFDFQPGDKIEQAIGNDPFYPIPFRSWTWDTVPSVFPAPIFDVANYGSANRTVMQVAGPSQFGNVAYLEVAMHNGLNVTGQIKKSIALLHQKDDNAQQIYWVKEARKLGVNPKTGTLEFNGALALNGRGLSEVKAVGGGNNLRGIAVTVAAGAKTVEATFATPEPDDKYVVTVQPSWPTNHAVTKKGASGFTVEFDAPAPDKARFDWLLVR
jgi:hypothetical protein